MTAAAYERRASIGHAPPLFGTADENNEWHRKIRDILDVSSSDPTLLQPKHRVATKKKAGPNRRRSMDDGIRPVMRWPTNRTDGDKNHSSACKDVPGVSQATSVHVAHEDSTASLSWSADSRKAGEGLEFSLSSLDVSPASPSNRRVLSSMYSYDRKKSKDSCGGVSIKSPLAEESGGTNLGDIPAFPFDTFPKSARNHGPEDLDSSFDAREEKFFRCLSAGGAKDDRTSSQNDKVNRTYTRRLSCSDAPVAPSTFLRQSLRSPYGDVHEDGYILPDPMESTPQAAAAPKFTIHVRRSSCGDTAAYPDIKLPFPTERRNTVRRYGRRGSEISFHVPLPKSAKERTHTKEEDADPSRNDRTTSPPKDDGVHQESGWPLPHRHRRSLNHGEVPRAMMDEKVRRRASCCDPLPKRSEAGMNVATRNDEDPTCSPRQTHRSTSRRNETMKCASEAPSEWGVDCPPIPFIVCKKTSKNSTEGKKKLNRGDPAFAYF